ncbi:MAG: hypothetical protein U5L06_10760 [Rhodovibrio sp.]|nr:hypothetical protein [Rhodovibrio sp.]
MDALREVPGQAIRSCSRCSALDDRAAAAARDRLVLEGGFAGLRTRRPWVHAARAALVALASSPSTPRLPTCRWRKLTAIAFAAPLIMTALSRPLLGENVGWRRWSAVLVGFLGVLIVVKPGTAAFQPAALIALAAALLYALMLVTARKFAASESAISLVFWSTAGAGLIAGALMPFTWTPVATHDAGWFLRWAAWVPSPCCC